MWVLGHDVAHGLGSVREVASDCNEDVYRRGQGVRCKHDTRCSERAVVADLIQNGEHLSCTLAKRYVVTREEMQSYILVARVCKHDHRKTGESRNRTLPFEPMDLASLRQRVARSKVIDDQDDQICDGY